MIFGAIEVLAKSAMVAIGTSRPFAALQTLSAIGLTADISRRRVSTARSRMTRN